MQLLTMRVRLAAAMIGPGSSNVVGGQFAMVKTKGRRIDDLILKSPAAMKVAFGENPKGSVFGRTKSPVTRSHRRPAGTLGEQRRISAAKAGSGGKEKYFAPDFEKECYLPVLRGDIPLKAHVHRVDDIVVGPALQKNSV